MRLSPGKSPFLWETQDVLPCTSLLYSLGPLRLPGLHTPFPNLAWAWILVPAPGCAAAEGPGSAALPSITRHKGPAQAKPRFNYLSLLTKALFILINFEGTRFPTIRVCLSNYAVQTNMPENTKRGGIGRGERRKGRHELSLTSQFKLGMTSGSIFQSISDQFNSHLRCLPASKWT